jgi:prefoldin alpha subunit
VLLQAPVTTSSLSFDQLFKRPCSLILILTIPVDVNTLSVPQLRNLQTRLSSELEHLTNSHAKLRSAQSKFKDCIRTIGDGVTGRKDAPGAGGDNILVPLTSSLYVKGKLADREKVIVDVGTGFYVEKV